MSYKASADIFSFDHTHYMHTQPPWCHHCGAIVAPPQVHGRLSTEGISCLHRNDDVKGRATGAGVPGYGLLAVLSSLQTLLQSPAVIAQFAALKSALIPAVEGPDTVVNLACVHSSALTFPLRPSLSAKPRTPIRSSKPSTCLWILTACHRSQQCRSQLQAVMHKRLLQCHSR